MNKGKLVTAYAQMAIQVLVSDDALDTVLDDLERDGVTIANGYKWQAMDAHVLSVDEFEIMQVEDNS